MNKLTLIKRLEIINPRLASEVRDNLEYKKVEVILTKEKENGKH